MADIVLILLIVMFAFSGYKKGFAKTLISTLANIISLAFSMTLTKPVSDLVFNSPAGNIISGIAKSAIESNAGNAQLSQSSIEMMADGIALSASSVISFIIVAIIVKILIMVFANTINVVAKLPLIRQANSTLGAVLGVVSGFVLVYVALGIIAILHECDTIGGGLFISGIENSFLCSILYYNNVVANTFSSIL